MSVLHVEGHAHLEATLLDVEKAIRHLDGAQHTLVLVELSSGETITVGGGPRRFVVELAESTTDRWCVVDPTEGEHPIELVVGGSLAGYPARLCVDLDVALEAALTFVSRRGARSARLVWSQET